MSESLPSADTVLSALALAARAPSVHNVQPWRWRIDDHGLHLYADQHRRLVHTDPDGRDTMVSCGVALHHCVVALAALGLHSRIQRFPNPADRSHLATIDVEPCAAGDVDVSLAAAIPRRRTDRRYYSAWPVPHGDIALMGARAARAGVTMRRVEPTTDLRLALAHAVWQHATDRDYLDELTTWSGRYGSTAGVPARSTPQSNPHSPVPGRLFAGAVLAQPDEACAEDDHGVLLALGTAADDDLARLRAGEATSLLLLTATALGLATCPVSEPLEISGTRNAIRTDAFGDDEFPQMLLRVGWAPVNADPLPATPRRPLGEVVVDASGQGSRPPQDGPTVG